MALNRNGGAWEGGYISLGRRDRKTFVIERRHQGVRYHISTGAHERRAALGHLDRFEKNPAAYRPDGDELDKALHITEADVIRYVAWTREVKGNTREHAREVKRYLAQWLEDLGDVDWRRLKLGALKTALAKRKTARAYRIASIKAFCAWLREEEGALTSELDVTRDLASIQAVPERQRREKKVPKDLVEKLLAVVDDRTRHFMVVKGSTGLHNSEIRRIVSGDRAVLEALDAEASAANGGCAGVARFLHKSGDWDLKRIETRQALDSLLALQKTGFTARSVNAAIKAGCATLGVPSFTVSVLRHSWGTWHAAAGADMAHISEGYGHKSERTSQRFYVQVAIPPKRLEAVVFDVPSVH